MATSQLATFTPRGLTPSLPALTTPYNSFNNTLASTAHTSLGPGHNQSIGNTLTGPQRGPRAHQGQSGEESAGRATSATSSGQSVMASTLAPIVSVSWDQSFELFVSRAASVFLTFDRVSTGLRIHSRTEEARQGIPQGSRTTSRCSGRCSSITGRADCHEVRGSTKRGRSVRGEPE